MRDTRFPPLLFFRCCSAVVKFCCSGAWFKIPERHFSECIFRVSVGYYKPSILRGGGGLIPLIWFSKFRWGGQLYVLRARVKPPQPPDKSSPVLCPRAQPLPKVEGRVPNGAGLPMPVRPLQIDRVSGEIYTKTFRIITVSAWSLLDTGAYWLLANS